MLKVCLSHLNRFNRGKIFTAHSALKGCASYYSTEPDNAESKGKPDAKVKYEDVPISRIRNFSIIAHVDHGKSTLADRLLEMTGTVLSSGSSQVLDTLQVEQERGITVKAMTASLRYTSILDGEEYLLNIIDTPGHVDFSNEVNRSLAACQGVVLLIDANQGVQAQTVANYYLAMSQNLHIIPVLNKIDLKGANPEACETQLQTLFKIDKKDVLKISAKSGLGVDELIEEIILRIPPPPSNREATLCALLYDSWYDRYRGNVIVLFVKDGHIRPGDSIQFAHTGLQYGVKSVGVLLPQEHPTTQLSAGQVGFITCNMRTAKEANIGDTVHLKDKPVPPMIGFKKSQPMVFSGVYPMDQSQHTALRSAIEKLALNDSAVTVATESSPALGQGWRLGFLGLLHLEVFNQRLEQEFGAQALMTVPSVTYKARIKGEKNIRAHGGADITIHNPTFFPDPSIIEELFEPWVSGTVITPVAYIGQVTPLCLERRGVLASSRPLDARRVMLAVDMPLNEIIVDFHDALKSASSGFASFDYEDKGYASSKLVRVPRLSEAIASSYMLLSKGTAQAQDLIRPQPPQQGPSDGGGPPTKASPEQVEHVATILRHDLPRLFTAHQDYRVYHPRLVFENHLRGTVTTTLEAYVRQVALLKLVGHLKYAYVECQVVKLTTHPADGTIKVRWRIKGLSGYKVFKNFWRYKVWNLRESAMKDVEAWYEGFSIFYVRADGQVHKHVLLRMQPDEDYKVGAFKTDMAAKVV